MCIYIYTYTYVYIYIYIYTPPPTTNLSRLDFCPVRALLTHPRNTKSALFTKFPSGMHFNPS